MPRKNTPSRYTRRPRAGDVLETFVGAALVTRVYGNGIRLDICDAIGRAWTIERAVNGAWTRSVTA